MPRSAAHDEQRLGIESDQRGYERTRVTNDDGLAYQGVSTQTIFERGWCDVLAAGGDDDLLLPTCDAQEAVRVELTDVAGAEPSVLFRRLRRGNLVAPVAREHLRSRDDDLAVVRDSDRRSGDGTPTVPGFHASARLTVSVGLVSVRPYPSKIRMPTPLKKCVSRSPSGPPPLNANRSLPPKTARSLW